MWGGGGGGARPGPPEHCYLKPLCPSPGPHGETLCRLVRHAWDIQYSWGIEVYELVRCSSSTGLCIDLLNNIAETISFNYTMYLVPDGNFGKKHPVTYQWNGLVKELVDRVSISQCILRFTNTTKSIIMSLNFSSSQLARIPLAEFVSKLILI